MRTFTPTAYPAPGRRIIHVKRACNGCGELIGDVTLREINDGIDGRPLSDVRDECDWCSTKSALAEVIADQAEFEADLAYLRGLSNAIIEHVLPATGHLYFPCGTTVEDDIVFDMPHGQFMAVLGEW